MAVSGIKDSLKQQGVRLTRQRKILLDLIDESGQHLDAERLFRLAREKDPKLNRVTVYRTLKLLKAGGLVDELDLMHHDGDQHYYETRLKQEHAHVICLRCGRRVLFALPGSSREGADGGNPRGGAHGGHGNPQAANAKDATRQV